MKLTWILVCPCFVIAAAAGVRAEDAAVTVVAVLDTGVDEAHPALEGALVPGVNIVAPGELPGDRLGHGTVMAGLIVARSENPEVRGWAAGTAVRVMPVKVVDGDAAAPAALAAGIDAAIKRRAAVVCIPLASPVSSAAVNAALDRARNAGILVVASAGGASGDFESFDAEPAAHPWVVSCTASEEGPLSLPDGRGVAAGDARGERVCAGCAATGETELMLDAWAVPIAVKGVPKEVRGISVACARVAALAALLRAAHPDWSAARVREVLVTAGGLPEGLREQGTERLRRASREGVLRWTEKREGPDGDLFVASIRRSKGLQGGLRVFVEVGNLGGAPLAGRVEVVPPGNGDPLAAEFEALPPGARTTVPLDLADVRFNEVALVRVAAAGDVNPENNATRVVCFTPGKDGVEIRRLRLAGRQEGAARVTASARVWNAGESAIDAEVIAGVGDASGAARVSLPPGGSADVEIPFDLTRPEDADEAPFVLFVRSGSRTLARAVATVEFGPAAFVPRLDPFQPLRDHRR
ncbi:MAG: S8 family serine peptidase [Planctomycetia bacterium]|nr:S8 family serine peptidase [Planctomycetia bacterium]